MKIKNVFCAFFLLFSLVFRFVNADNIKTPDDENLKNIVDFEDSMEDETPLQFSKRCMKDFFHTKSVNVHLQTRPIGPETEATSFNTAFIKYVKNAYNNPGYADILSQDSTDIIQFLELGNELNLGSDTIYIGMRLFYNKIKGCELVDDTMVMPVLTAFSQFLEKFFDEQEETEKHNLDFIKKNIENVILSRFISNMHDFQSTPDIFVAHLSTEIVNTLKQELEKNEKKSIKKEMRERLRQITIRFFRYRDQQNNVESEISRRNLAFIYRSCQQTSNSWCS